MSKFKYTINGNTYEVAIERYLGDVAEVTVNGVTYEVGILREERRPPRLDRTKAVAGGAPQPERMRPQGILGEVRAPLPGVVVAVPVKPDDTVAQGQCLCVVEAMKMENEVYAPLAGKVAEVRVQAGQNVLEGDLLVRVEGGE